MTFRFAAQQQAQQAAQQEYMQRRLQLASVEAAATAAMRGGGGGLGNWSDDHEDDDDDDAWGDAAEDAVFGAHHTPWGGLAGPPDSPLQQGSRASGRRSQAAHQRFGSRCRSHFGCPLNTAIHHICS